MEYLSIFLSLWLVTLVSGKHPMCQLISEVQRAGKECLGKLESELPTHSQGCRGLWDNISCWHHAQVGDVVTISCPLYLQNLFGTKGNISRNCSSDGWSDMYPDIKTVCWDIPTPSKLSILVNFGKKLSLCVLVWMCILLHLRPDGSRLVFYVVVRTLYTLGHSLSLIALITGSAILCLFRKLHCTRNYIHLNLFFSFILRAIAVLTKDSILFSHEDDCTEQTSFVGCKVSLVFFHYFIMANFFWLLVEGLYLHTLLMVIFSENRHFIVYLLVGWGVPTVFVIAWIITRVYIEDTGCWERNDNVIPWRVINWPVMASIIINFILFISIIRILIEKLRCPDVAGPDQSQYKRLAKSTLLLIPLFGVNYVVFVYIMEKASDALEKYKIFFDLGIGSFQGLVVAILYCFLNSEVQGELKRKWRSVCLKRYVGHRQHSSSVSRNGLENTAMFRRNTRAQSFLQTETTMV